ncbi:MAG: hypothetical protein ACR2GL_04740 [Thermoleophilaceae bacterium]
MAKLPKLRPLGERRAALREAAAGYRDYERDVLAPKQKRFDRALRDLTRGARP